MSEYNELLREAYRGEIFGPTLFGALADKQPDEERREKLRALETLEARTAQSLRRLLEDAQITDLDEAGARKDGVDLAAAIDPEDWNTFVTGLKGALPPYLASFERLREVSARPDPALDALVNHEIAIDRFTDLELAGAGRDALKPITDHLRTPV